MSGRRTRGGCGSKIDRDRRPAALARLAPHALEQPHVAAMQAVEIAERRHRIAATPARGDRESGRPASRRGSRSRSPARGHRTRASCPAGRPRTVAAWPRSCAMCVKYVRRAPMRAPGDHRFVDREMRRVRPVPQRVEHEHVEPPAQRRRLSGMPLQSVRYAKAPKRNPRIGHGPCWTGTGTTPDGRAERPADRPRAAGPARRRPRRALIEDVAERAGAASSSVCRPPYIGIGAPLQRVEAPDLVEPHDVIGVRVRQQDRVDAAQADAAAPAIANPASCPPAPAGRRRISTKIDGRQRVSRGSVERQTAQSQPIMGTP